MSVRFQIASVLVKASGMKKLFALPQGLCHCYPAASFCPEGKQAQDEIFGLLRK